MTLFNERTSELTRRKFLRGASLTGAAWAASNYAMPAWARGLGAVAQAQAQPLVDKGFASARKIGEGVYAIISDTSKGFDTLCNGGFVVGKDAVLLWEGYASQAGATFQLETLKTVSKVPVKAAIDSHYHFDHSFGNAKYASSNIPIWAHEKVAPLMQERYLALQNKSKAA